MTSVCFFFLVNVLNVSLSRWCTLLGTSLHGVSGGGGGGGSLGLEHEEDMNSWYIFPTDGRQGCLTLSWNLWCHQKFAHWNPMQTPPVWEMKEECDSSLFNSTCMDEDTHENKCRCWPLQRYAYYCIHKQGRMDKRPAMQTDIVRQTYGWMDR